MSTTIAPSMMGLDAPPVPNRMTPEEFAEKYDGQRVEYIYGQVVEMPMSEFVHGCVCNMVSFLITSFVLQNDLGRVTCNDTWLKVPMPDDTTKVRGADVFFISYRRLPKGKMKRGLLQQSPELVAEVKSPSDSWPKIKIKVAEYLANNVLAVVVFDPTKETATVYRNTGETKLASTDTLELPDILPGFRVPVAKFFA